MKVETNVNGDIVLKRVFNGIRLITDDNDQMILCMRDTGFEFKYGDVWYEAKKRYCEHRYN
jgi:hypothetical protein